MCFDVVFVSTYPGLLFFSLIKSFGSSVLHKSKSYLHMTLTIHDPCFSSKKAVTYTISLSSVILNE